MKNVLMITSVFPPEPYVGGLRPGMFSKYLPQYGWQPYILTGRTSLDKQQSVLMEIKGIPSDKFIHEIFVKKQIDHKAKLTIFDKFKSLFFPDLFQVPGFVEPMLKEGEKIIKDNNIDAIYATSPDIGSLTVANILSKKYMIPWVADFRDIQEQDKIVTFRDRLLHFRMKYRRKVIVKSASAVITVSRHHADILATKLNKHINVIPNGFDSEVFKPNLNHKSNKFTIVYMGRILDEWTRNPRLLFDAMSKMMLKNKDLEKNVEILFYGTEPEIINNILKDYTCHSVVKVLPRINYVEVPTVLQNSCINLVLTNRGRDGILTTKMFEYLAVKRPILSIPDDGGELSQLIKKTNAGFVCNSVNEVITALEKWYKEWKDIATIKCKSNDNEIMKFSRKEQTEELAKILLNV